MLASELTAAGFEVHVHPKTLFSQALTPAESYFSRRIFDEGAGRQTGVSHVLFVRKATMLQMYQPRIGFDAARLRWLANIWKIGVGLVGMIASGCIVMGFIVFKISPLGIAGIILGVCWVIAWSVAFITDHRANNAADLWVRTQNLDRPSCHDG